MIPAPWFLVQPVDTAWLRAGQPLVAGEGDANVQLFPPSSWSWQGLIRTRLLLASSLNNLDTAARGEIERIVGPPDALPAGWRIRGPFPADEADVWVPTPQFLVGTGRTPLRAWESTAHSDEDVLAGTPDHPLTPVPLTRPPGTEALGGWITLANLRWAVGLGGGWTTQGYAPDLPPFVAEEVRTGISIDPTTGTAADAMLYAATHHRFVEGSGLVGALLGAAPSPLHRGSGPFGRAGRPATFAPYTASSAAWLGGDQLLGGDVHQIGPGARIAVVLLTPGIDAPRLPDADLDRAYTHAGPDTGGFDRINAGSRPVRATWAAGSTWIWRLRGSTVDARRAAVEALLSPANLNSDERFGFGQRLVALLPSE